MKTITKVCVCAKNKSRSNLYLNNDFYCTMDNLLVVKYGLKEGIEIEETELERLQEENEFSTALDSALNYISRYKKTKKQLIEYLMKKGYVYSVAFKVVDKLSSYGYVDDGDFARSFATQNTKNKGKLLIKMQLRAKGVDENTAEQAVNELEDEAPFAVELAKKYMRSKEITRENLAKCYRYILSKGFSYESAQKAVNAIKEEDDY